MKQAEKNTTRTEEREVGPYMPDSKVTNEETKAFQKVDERDIRSEVNRLDLMFRRGVSS